VGWPEVEEDNGHYGQLRHYSDVSLFHNGIFKPFCRMAKERNSLLIMAQLQISR
jgi:hypothetical protein